MTKQEYLCQYLVKWDEIKRLKLEIEQLRTRSEEITQALSGMPGGGAKEGFRRQWKR